VKKSRWLIVVAAACSVTLTSWTAGTVNTPSETAFASAPALTAPFAPDTKPVEDDMHEFMEYVFQPTYLRLKASMKDEPQDNNAWKAIKSDSLILAEGGNLLLIRLPDDKDEADTWKEHAVSVREFGGQLYRTAKKKDYEASVNHYLSMINRCNSCHDAFADGEHQLIP
jgi:hypothetical protein